MIIIIPIMLSLTLVLIFRFMNKKHEPPIFGVYQRRNKYFWLKFVLMFVYLTLRQLVVHVKRLLAVELGYSYDGTVNIHEHDVALEQKHPLGDYPKAVDGVYFNGLAKNGTGIVCGLARRPENICDAFMFLRVNGEELYLTPSLPDTYLEQSAEEVGEYSVQAMTIDNFIPMRTWKLSYNGEMKSKTNPEKQLKVTMQLTWSANWDAFNYDRHISPFSMAQDMAREPWSADYFSRLRRLHQTHYEQMGYLAGSVFIDGKEHEINMPCVRDHSAANLREWRNFHRYVYHFIYLENGDCIAVGSVSQPIVLSHLTIGYVCRQSDQAVLPVKDCDFKLWQHGENQILPKDYGFTFEAGGEMYHVKVLVKDETSFYIGKLREAKFYERWSTVDVNGIMGWACVEWQYNNVPANEH